MGEGVKWEPKNACEIIEDCLSYQIVRRLTKALLGILCYHFVFFLNM